VRPTAARFSTAVTAALSLSLLLCVSGVAAADDQPAGVPRNEEPRESGLRLGLRTGVALPFGSAFTGSGSLSDTITGYVPLRIDVGFRFARRFYVGVDGQLAAIVPAGCTGGFTCSGTNTRIGVMVAYHFAPGGTFDPHVGVGTGYEVLHTSRSIDGAAVDITARGFELLDLEAGGDVRLGGAWRIGPVLSGSMGRFTSVAVNGTPSTDYETATHAWAMLGIRGAFDL
jgi:opacity protein-like surface antigen